MEDREQHLWIGTLGNGLDLFDRQTNRFKHHTLPNNIISSMLQDKKGNVWIGTVRGIGRFGKRS